MAIKLRELTDEEKAAIAKLARSRTAAAREVERARIILLASKGKRAPAIAQELELTEITVRVWLKRFNMDEMGPVAAKSYPGHQLARVEPQSEPRRPAQRARQEIDYGRRDKGCVFGAFRPVTGEALTKT